jgi:hypothetical protein
MSKRRVARLACRARQVAGPLAFCRTVEEYRAALERLSDEELEEELQRAVTAWAASLSNEELLAEIDRARAEVQRMNEVKL